MSTPIRTAVLGYGFAGRIFHSPFIAAVPGLELSVIVQRHGDNAAADYPKTRIVRTVEEVFADPAIDLIVVGTPNETHFELAKAALEAGKHVVIDKPFAASSAQARALITLAAQQGKVLAPFHNRRYDSDFVTLRKLVAEGTLGRITQVISHYDRYRPIRRAGTWKEEGGAVNGLLFDLGPHLVDQALALYGAPQFITASVRSERDVTKIEDAFDIVLDFEIPNARGIRYECHSTMVGAEAAPRFRVHGTNGSFVKYGLDPQEAALLAGARPPQVGSQEPWLPEPEAAWGTLALAPNPAEPTIIERSKLPSEVGDYRHFYTGVRDAILRLSPLAIPAEDAYRTVRLLELALQSSEQKRTLGVDFRRVN
ncbi:MAG TPA: oxidoreductase [Acidobacteriaceae bacterium]